jgi:hypothetical protein
MELYEIEGFLRGKCLPGDLLVGESNAQYLFRKLKERDVLERELCMSEAKCKGYFSDAAVALLKCDALAAENVELKELIGQHANSFSACPNCSHEEPSETDDIVALYRSLETPATDAAIANIQAHAIPDGWKLIPEELHISEEGIELICSQCGNGDEEYGEFVDGVFRVGEVETDDGKKVYGLHVTCADYPEEGSVTIAIFDNQLRKERTHD